MSIFSFFSRKAQPRVGVAPDSSGLGQVDATLPLMPADNPLLKHAVLAAGQSANRKSERHEQRELLYSVVRDTMAWAGVLAASYQFKVLSLDTRGKQYLIMMDLVDGSAMAVGRMAEIETMLAQSAKARHAILVSAVYWRLSVQVTVGQSMPADPRSASAQVDKLAPAQPTLPVAPPGFEPLQRDEIAAFKRANINGSVPTDPPAKGKVTNSGHQSQKSRNDFEDTQISPTLERSSPLSVTQYGDLK